MILDPLYFAARAEWPYLLLGGMLVLLLGGCVTHLAPPPGSMDDSSLTEEEADKAWSQTLQSYVEESGTIQFKKLSANPADLYRYLSYIASVSPQTHPERFPNRSQKLAFYINSYNALAMYGIIQKGIPKDFNEIFDRAEFFKFTKFKVGGLWISLVDYENQMIRPLGEPRVHFALNCMTVGCPRLPRILFRAETLEQQLTQAAREFLNDDNYLYLNHTTQTVYLSEILDFYTEDFVGPKAAPSLAAYVNRYRRESVPESYNLKFIPYDWTVNQP